MEDDDETLWADGQEDGVQFRAVRRIGKRGQYIDEDDDGAALKMSFAGGLGSGDMDDSILEANVEEVASEDDQSSLKGLVFKGLVRVLDFMLLGLEFVVVEAIPTVVKRGKVAARRVNDAVNGEVGQDGWDLLPVFDKPMRSQIMSTRR